MFSRKFSTLFMSMFVVRDGDDVHLNTYRWVEETQQNFIDTSADRKVRRDKVNEAQKHKPTVTCTDKTPENVFQFKYLSSCFTADCRRGPQT